jgi:hypothetical protein
VLGKYQEIAEEIQVGRGGVTLSGGRERGALPEGPYGFSLTINKTWPLVWQGASHTCHVTGLVSGPALVSAAV